MKAFRITLITSQAGKAPKVKTMVTSRGGTEEVQEAIIEAGLMGTEYTMLVNEDNNMVFQLNSDSVFWNDGEVVLVMVSGTFKAY